MPPWRITSPLEGRSKLSTLQDSVGRQTADDDKNQKLLDRLKQLDGLITFARVVSTASEIGMNEDAAVEALRGWADAGEIIVERPGEFRLPDARIIPLHAPVREGESERQRSRPFLVRYREGVAYSSLGWQAKAVLHAMAVLADRGGYLAASYEEVARLASIGRTTAWRGFKDAEQAGWIEQTYRGGRPVVDGAPYTVNGYRLTLPAGVSR
jgi:hypothetical protein